MDANVQKIELIMGLRAQGIRDTRVLEAIEKVPRELFLPTSVRAMAYADQALPIECGQTISQPFIVAYMTEKLAVTDLTKVLEVGTGSGYQTAVLSYLCRRVYTIERYRTLAKAAERRLAEMNRRNVTAMIGDGTMGWPAKATTFERIMVTACAPAGRIPPALFDQLAEGGRMLIPVEFSADRQELQLIERTATGFERQSLLPVRFVPLLEGIARAE